MPHFGIEIRALTPEQQAAHLEPEDAAKTSRGFMTPYVIAIINAERNEITASVPEAWYSGAPGLAGVYADPRTIRDAGIAEHAADMWTESTQPVNKRMTVRPDPFLVDDGLEVLVSWVEYTEGGDCGRLATGYVHAGRGGEPTRYHLSELIPIEEKN